MSYTFVYRVCVCAHSACVKGCVYVLICERIYFHIRNVYLSCTCCSSVGCVLHLFVYVCVRERVVCLMLEMAIYIGTVCVCIYTYICMYAQVCSYLHVLVFSR